MTSVPTGHIILTPGHLEITLQKRLRRVNRFSERNISSRCCMNNTIHILKPTQMVQNVSRIWQLPHFTLKTLMTQELFGHKTAPLFLNAKLEGILLALKKSLILTKNLKEVYHLHWQLFCCWKLKKKTFRTKNMKRFYNLEKITTTDLNNHSMDPITCRHYWKRKSKLIHLQKQDWYRAWPHFQMFAGRTLNLK